MGGLYSVTDDTGVEPELSTGFRQLGRSWLPMRGRMTTHMPFVAQPADLPLAAALPPAPASMTALPMLSRLVRALGRRAAHEQLVAARDASHGPADQPEGC